MKPAIVFAAVIAAMLAGCTEPARETAGSSAPVAPTPTVSASSDHAAMDHAMGTSGMESLRSKTGKAFDIAYLSQMVAHHTAAVKMAGDALTVATKPETKREAQKVIGDQKKEIEQMTGWLKSWYETEPDKDQQALVSADMKGMMAMRITSDTMFYEMMIPHHQGAIDMSELALKNAGRAEVKELARKIIAAQKAEIAKYKKMMPPGG